MFSSFLPPHTDEFVKMVITLFKPVAMLFWDDSSPAPRLSDSVDAAETANSFQLVFAAQIVAYVVKSNLPLLLGVRMFNQQSNGNWGAAATTKNLPAFLS